MPGSVGRVLLPGNRGRGEAGRVSGKCMGVVCSLGFGGLPEGSELTTSDKFPQFPASLCGELSGSPHSGDHYEGRKCLGWRWALSGCPQMVWQMILVFFVGEVQTCK